MSETLRLVSFDLCPYVERSRIALHEKGLAHEVTFIDLRDKPDWFLRISPMGKVPLLLVDERPIFESMVINELIEELHPAPRLFPSAPLERAEARGWIVFANDTLMPAGFKAQLGLAAAHPPDLPALLKPVEAALTKIEERLSRSAGPYFLGADFSLVDAVYAPFLRRWRAAEAWHDTRLLKHFPRLTSYTESVLSRPSAVKSDPGEVGPRMRQLLLSRA